MNRSIILLAVVAALVLAAQPTSAQVLQRHVAEFRFGAEQSTAATAAAFPGPPDGSLIYLKSFFLPATQRTLFVTLSTTGDAHDGVAHWFSARVNGVLCNKGNEGAGFAPGGWVPLQKHFDYENITYFSNGVGGQTAGDGGGGTGDMHDNGIYYTWCCVEGLQPGTMNRVEIKMATSFAGTPVFVERSHYYIDSVDKLLCNEADPLPVPTGEPTAIATEEEAAAEAALEENRSKN